MIIDLNCSPVKNVRIIRHGSFNNKIVSCIGKEKITAYNIAKISDWLTFLGIKHHCWKDKVSFSDEIEVINILTKKEKEKIELEKEKRKKDLDRKKLLLAFSIPIQNFIQNNFKDCNDYSKYQICKMLNGDLSHKEVGLHWNISRFKDVIKNLELDISGFKTLDDIWSVINDRFIELY